MRIRIIGAGIAGLTCAVELLKLGASVEIIDRSPGLGADSCSWFAGGMLAPWCELESAESLVARLGAEALTWWQAHHPGMIQKGSLVIAPSRDVRELQRFGRKTSHFDDVGGDRIAELEPDLAGRFHKGLFFSDEAHLNPREALASLVGELKRQGVTPTYETPDDGAHENVDHVIDCRGFAARDQLDDLRGVKGEMLLIRTADLSLKRPVRLLHPRIPLYIVPRADNVFMVGATMIENEERTRISARSMVELLNAAYTVHPAFGEAEVLEIGTDVRPAFPDNLPRIRTRGQTTYINGFYRHGYLLAPSVARMAADHLVNGTFYPEVMDENHPERRRA